MPVQEGIAKAWTTGADAALHDEAALPANGTASGQVNAAVDEKHAMKRLLELQQQIADKERETAELRQQVRALGTDAVDSEIQKRLADLPRQVQKLRESFEQIAVSGLDLGILTPEPPKEYQWQTELLEIVRPVLSGLKELTEKPRRIEFLRQEIDRSSRQMTVIDEAVSALERLRAAGPPKPIARSLEELHDNWLQRRSETASNLEVLQFKLASLQDQNGSSWDDAIDILGKFAAGRGATLLLAAVVAVVIWFGLGALLKLALRLTRGPDARTNRKRERALIYLGRAIRGLLVVTATLVVFYVRSDVLLLALSIVAIVMLAAGLRQTVPRYIAEIHILLDFGPVREGERIIHNGIPMQIRSIQAYAKLTNPELDGVVRLPLYQLTELLSRPPGSQDEPWFPTRPGETVQFADKRLAEVLSQSVDTVQLRMRGSLVNMSTREFMACNPMNLTREGFIVVAKFDLDYRHRDICLDEVPEKLRAALREAVDASELGEHCRDVIVEFNEAGLNALNYLILLPFAGTGAHFFHTASRLVQRTLVALCNVEAWSIPFGQLTIHQGEGFGGPTRNSEQHKQPQHHEGPEIRFESPATPRHAPVRVPA